MVKPKTTYTKTTKPVNTFTRVTKPRASFAVISKNKSTFGVTTKNTTNFSRNSSVASWLLNSTVVTLNSTIYRLNGYLTTVAPDQLGNKNPITYTVT